MILTWISLALKLLGFADMAQRMLDKANARKDGMDQQALADSEASLKAAADATRASGVVAGESDAQVRADLEGDFRK